MLEIKEFFPTGTIKRKNDEHIEVTAIVTGINPIVEVWTNMRGRDHGYEMSKDAEHKSIYRIKLHIPHTGRFFVKVRAREPEQDYWTWSEQSVTVLADPAWTKQAVVYNAFVRFYGAHDSDGDGVIKPGEGGTFDDIKHDLDRLESMGVNVIYLNPIHPIGELFRNYNPHDLLPHYLQPGCPYSIRDYKSIDPELGLDKDNEDKDPTYSDPMTEFKEFINEAHKRGIRVFMDLVFNHTAHDCVFQRLHPEWFLYKEDIKSLDAPYIHPEEVGTNPWGKAQNTFCPFDHGYWWEDVAQLNWEYQLPQAQNDPPKNPTLPQMYNYFKSIPKYWVKNFGIDGFRCDVAYHIPPDFWRECIDETRQMAKDAHPENGSLDADVVFIAESYVDDLEVLLEAGFTACYGNFHQKLWRPLTLKGYLDYIYNLDGQYFPDGSDWFHFPECHDGTRITEKIASVAGHEQADIRTNKSRWVLTATLPGIPMIFNGYERVEWKAVNLFGYSAINWESKEDITEYIAQVNKARSIHPALAYGKYVYLETEWGLNEQTQMMSYARVDEKEQLIVVVNMDVTHSINGTKIILEGLDINYNLPFEITDILTGKTYTHNTKEIPIFLEPGESHLFLVTQNKTN